MRWGLLKFLLIPALLIGYIQFVQVLASGSAQIPGFFSDSSSDRGGLSIGFGESVSVTVTRQYLFGMIRLPIYTGSLGSIAWMHETFFTFLSLLIAGFVFWEAWDWMRPKNSLRFSPQKFEKRGGNLNIDFNKLAKRLGKAIGIGLLVGFLALLFSASAEAFGTIAVLVAYLEFRWHNK